jgi:hypothetical protein
MGVSRVDFGDETLIDLTEDSVTPQTLILGATAHNSAGEPIEGEFDPDIYQTKEDETLKTEDKSVVGAINELNIDIIKLNAWYDENHYVKMTGSFTATNSGGTYEIGSSITSTFTWSFSKLPTTLTVGGVSKTPTQTGTTASQTFTASSQTSRTFTIKGVYAGVYGNETVEKTWTYNFRNKVYYGCLPLPDDGIINSSFIKRLSESSYATTYKNSGFNLGDTSTDKYIWYAFPARFIDTYGEPVFTMGGFQGGFNKIEGADVDSGKGFTNGQNFTESYCVYRSTNAGVGDLAITVG